MKFNQTLTIQSVAAIIDCPFIGNSEVEITGINEIHKVVPGDIVFVDHPKYYKKALNSAADVIIINKKVDDIPTGKALIISDTPFDDFNKLTRHFRADQHWSSDIGVNLKKSESQNCKSFV